MSGRVKRGFFNDDGLWIQYWQGLGDPAEEPPQEHEVDHTPELILALGALTDKQRFVIECRYGFHGWPRMTEVEIGRLMGISQPAVSRLYQRGMCALRRGLCESSVGAYFDISRETHAQVAR